MHLIRRASLMTGVLILAIGSPGVQHVALASAPRDTRYVIRFKDGTPDKSQNQVVSSSNATFVREIDDDAIAVNASSTSAVKDIAGDSLQVESVHVDNVLHAFTVPNDPCYSGCTMSDGVNSIDINQWNLKKVGSEKAWSITQGSSSVKVAVLDTGVDSHSQLIGKYTSAPSFVTGSAHTDDQNGHGTHVAGIIAAATNDATDIAGLGWNTNVLNVRVLDDSGNGYASDIAAGIRYAADHSVKIVNMSLGATVNDSEISAAIKYAQGKGVLIIAAAGNGNSNLSQKIYPAANAGVLSVAASTSSDSIASYSHRGTWVDIAAPGSKIISTVTNDQYGLEYGTSMAAPHVAAAAALIKAKHPKASAGSIALRLFANADPISGTGKYFKYGRLNVYRALKYGVPAMRVASVSGKVYSLGSAENKGSLSSAPSSPIVAIASTPSAKGYWLAGAGGAVYSFGSSNYYGRVNGPPSPIVSIVATPTGSGYWLVAANGKIYRFGDAHFYGDTSSLRLNKPIVGMTATTSGNGYWLTASDGGIFAFGGARFYGGTGSLTLNKPIFDMTTTNTGKGYWLVASDGGVFAFGDARFCGSAASSGKTIAGIKRATSGQGYWMVTTGGTIYEYGTAVNLGNAGSAGGKITGIS